MHAEYQAISICAENSDKGVVLASTSARVEGVENNNIKGIKGIQQVEAEYMSYAQS